jgi:very-short-patch-repair endonuclease
MKTININPSLMQPDRIRGTAPDIIAAARRLRLNLTPAEQKLWQALSKRQLNGMKFRCQHPVGPFIVDFYCPEHRLVIELDGSIHDQQTEQDTARTAQLNQFGYHVIRFRNETVLNDLEQVLHQILEATTNVPHQSPQKSP